MDIEELNNKIERLESEKRKLKLEKELEKYPERAAEILGSDVNYGAILKCFYGGYALKTIHFTKSYGRGCPNWSEPFSLKGISYIYDWIDDYGEAYFNISKEDGEPFTHEEIMKYAPEFPEYLQEKETEYQRRLDIIKNIEKKKLEKVTTDAK